MSFSCFQYEEVKERCSAQCDHCKSRYPEIEELQRTAKKKVKRVTYKTRAVTLRIDEEVYSKIQKIAYSDHRTVNNVIDTMIKNELGLISYDFDQAMKNPIIK